ncbi:MAG: winged helix-turn-helix domain-containing protein [Candidatus Bathyarchaeota archaeon]|nr:winged helix-turn-helix domain-containing protein [Candidatus Bathyarchaeota archaeon]
MSSRRDRLHIVNEILKMTRVGASKTRIMYKANLNFKLVNQYLNFMLKNNLLQENTEDRRILYRASEKGITFQRNYDKLIQLLH